MRGNKRSKRLIAKRKVPALPTNESTNEEEKKVFRGPGLKTKLIADYCRNGSPSLTQLLLIDSLIRLIDMSQGELPPKDLMSNLTGQKGLIKMLIDLRQGTKPSPANGKLDYRNLPSYSKLEGNVQDAIDGRFKLLEKMTSIERNRAIEQMKATENEISEGETISEWESSNLLRKKTMSEEMRERFAESKEPKQTRRLNLGNN